MKKLLIFFLLSVKLFAYAGVSLPDSFLTERKVIELTLCSPDTSYAIIQSMRELKLVTAWRLDCLEAEYYINQRQYRRAAPLLEKVLNNPEIGDSTLLQMRLMMHLMYVNDRLQEDDNLTEIMYRLDKMADELDDDYFKAHTLFMYGKRLHYQGDHNGLESCQKAVDLLQKCDNALKTNSLRSFYGHMLLMYQEDGLYNDAIRMSLRQEEIARIPSYVKMRDIDSRALRVTYALRASLYAEMGDSAEANKAYILWQKTKGGNPIDDKYILGYLEKMGLYDEALNVIKTYENHLSTEQDSVSHWMLTMLGHESIIYGILGRIDESLVTARKIKSLTETLHKRESQEMSSVVNRFLQEEEKHSRRDVMQVSLGFLYLFIFATIIAFIFYVIFYYYLHKNMKVFLKPPFSRKRVKKRHDSADTNMSDKDGEKEEDSSPADYPVPDTNDLGQLYDYMNKLVDREKLFLDPSLNRDELMRILGIDKNRFGKMMTQYSEAGNISAYINTKRAEYGAELLKSHPEYTVATIAEMSGMASTVNFNRIFRNVYGLTPSEYRNSVVNTNGGGRR